MIDERPGSVYRFFNATGDLLYVGISVNLPRRLANHARNKSWWHEVASAQFVHYPSVELARAEELRAIQAENPRHNIADTSPRTDPVTEANSNGGARQRKVGVSFDADQLNYNLAIRGWSGIDCARAAGVAPDVVYAAQRGMSIAPENIGRIAEALAARESIPSVCTAVEAGLVVVGRPS